MGGFFPERKSYRLGFVDELGDFDTAVERAKRSAHISSAELVDNRQIFDLSNFLRSFGQNDAKSVKVESPGLTCSQIARRVSSFPSPNSFAIGLFECRTVFNRLPVNFTRQ